MKRTYEQLLADSGVDQDEAWRKWENMHGIDREIKVEGPLCKHCEQLVDETGFTHFEGNIYCDECVEHYPKEILRLHFSSEG